jgi:hypothetical protein
MVNILHEQSAFIGRTLAQLHAGLLRDSLNELGYNLLARAQRRISVFT